jgi:ABC-type multidrug transport system ATPase subunit
MNADLIFVVANGQVIEQGSHEELVAKNGKYAELWSKQIFVKPKERKEGNEESGTSSQSNSIRTNELTDEALSEASPSEAIESLSTVEEAEADTDVDADRTDAADGEDNGTPVKHKKEVDPSKNQL